MCGLCFFCWFCLFFFIKIENPLEIRCVSQLQRRRHSQHLRISSPQRALERGSPHFHRCGTLEGTEPWARASASNWRLSDSNSCFLKKLRGIKLVPWGVGKNFRMSQNSWASGCADILRRWSIGCAQTNGWFWKSDGSSCCQNVLW